MNHNPDIYLLYEYKEKMPFTVRMKVCLDAPVDAALLTEAAQEAIGRFPYFSVRVGLDEGQNYTLGDRRELDAAGQSFAFYPLLSGREGNPYTHGAAAFAVRDGLAISAELLCTEDFTGDPQAILEQFLNGIHYGE